MCGGGGGGGGGDSGASARQEALQRQQMEEQRRQFEEQMAFQRAQQAEQRAIAMATPPPAPEKVATAAMSAVESPTAATGVPGATAGQTAAGELAIRAGIGRRKLRTDVAGGTGGLSIPGV